MNDVGRLRDGGTAFERRLLSSARSDGMSPEARRALLTAFAGGAAGAVGAASAASASGAAGAESSAGPSAPSQVVGGAKAALEGVLKSRAVKWMAIGTAGVAVAAAVAIGAARRLGPGQDAVPAESGTAAVQSPNVLQDPGPAPSSSAMAPEMPSVSSAPAQVSASAPSSTTSRTTMPSRPTTPTTPTTPAALTTTTPAESTTLAAELRLIERARAAQSAGRPQDALAALEEHRARFSRGVLSEEAAVLRIEATAQAGDEAAATKLAKAFLAARPHSPYAARVRRIAGVSMQDDGNDGGVEAPGEEP